MTAAAPTATDRAFMPSPYRAEIDCGWADLDIPGWPRDSGPRALRGALIAALMPVLPGGEHSDWTGRQEGADGPTLERPPPICYRLHDGRPQVYAVGPRTRDHLLALAYYLRAVRTPDGTVLPVASITPTVRRAPVHVATGDQYLYRLATPLYPSKSAYERRPMRGAPGDIAWPGPRSDLHGARVAWAALVLHGAIATWLRDTCGLVPGVQRPLNVQVLEYHERPGLTFARADRDVREVRHGFRATFAANALLPPGVGLGAHASEGYGECWVC